DPDRPGLALQQIAPPESAPFAFPLIDLSGLPDPDPEVRRLAIADGLRPFDLEVGPLARQSLLRLDDQTHVVLFCQHHSMSDGWSISVLIREVAEHYTAFVAGREPRVPELPVQYADFSAWQREWLSGEEFDRQIRYWTDQLAGIPPFLDLPTDRPRSNGPSYRGADVPYAAPPEVIEPVKALTRGAGATLFMTLLAAYGALLGRWAGQDDIVIGSPIAGRHRAEVENLIGFFINGITLRVGLGGNPTARELIGRARDVTLGSYAHQDIPFNLVVEAMQPDRGLAVRPLFNVLLGLQNTPESWLTLPGLKLRSENLPTQTAKYELSLVVSESNGGLYGGWELDIGLLDPATVQRLSGHLTRLLREMAANPDRPVADLPLLPAEEEHQLRLEWNDTARALPSGLAGLDLPEIVARQARRTPEAPALSFAGHEISYGELHRRAVRLAVVLRGLGVGPETAVAVCSGRSPHLVVALLGILEAGGHYVPLDPSHPQERLAWLIEDSRAVLVLTEDRKDPRDFQDGVRVIGLEKLIDQALGEEGAPPRATGRPGVSALACLIYTSGSTGRPKGVGVTHSGIARMACDSGFLEVGPGDRMGHVANPAFDASTFEIWTALLRGACLVGIEKEALLSPPA
ncbi:MAG TPA: condensation domain-containing protein, partial [Thermoanaerobaculia bacterium]|nr:condensation domain-containing protein [Thermoanaerobaculia bacterium]